MAQGFFSSSKFISKPKTSLIPKCGLCGLYKKCASPKIDVQGDGAKEILIVGEWPNGKEDSEGLFGLGEGGQILKRELFSLGINLQKDCWLTKALICKPSMSDKVTSEKIEACRPNLLKTIDRLEPKVVILLGYAAIKSLVGHAWKENVGMVSQWAGWKIPCRKPNVWICPTFTPSYAMRDKKKKAPLVLFRRHLNAAIEIEKQPWESEPPDYKKQVENIFDLRKAASVINQMNKRGGLCAFDYETNMLKPDSDEGKLVCCSICWQGKRTICFPMEGEAQKALSDFLKSDSTKKIASNMKFEERWTRAKLGHGVSNWYWDTMQMAHLFDNRRSITSIKFQSFMWLGVPSYDEHIHKYLMSDGTYHENRIDEIGIDDLFLYCGLDSILEYHVAVKQMTKAGIL